MEYEIFNFLKGYTLEVILIGLGVFLFTYLIKWPIKKLTSKLDENRRKAVNIVIVFVPLVVSLVASILYYGLAQHIWATLMVFDSSFGSWLFSLSLYAIVSRIWLLIKGIWSGRIKVNSELTTETIKYIKGNIGTISKQIKVEAKNLNSIISKIEELSKLRDLLIGDTINPDLQKISEINSEIASLQKQQEEIENAINKQEQIVKNYNDKLYSTEQA